MKNLLLLLPFFFIFTCKSQPQNNLLLELSKVHKVLFLNSKDGGEAITTDEKEHFFNLVNKLDMSIQMKKNYPPETPREKILEDYKTHLKADVLEFSKEDMEFINGVMKEAYELCNKVSTNIFPKEIKLIKVSGNHYGDGAYYTRENCIIIPQDQLTIKNRKGFLETMFHEISHIYTRYNPEKRDQLYDFIGFKNTGNRSSLLIKEELNDRILLNPDGVNFAFKIELKEMDGRDFTAIPIIISNETKYTENKSDFFDYIHFSLFKIRFQHSARVISTKEGDSTVDMDNIPEFFEQITDNTGYIIHPDEIIADNFMYIMMREKKDGLNQEFSESGVELLKNIKDVLEK